jgi:RNA polymerase sigma-70 factor (ECF subfamily)
MLDQSPPEPCTSWWMATSGLSKPDASQARRWGEVHPETGGETDEQLVAALRRGDGAAAGRLYDRYAGSVTGMVYRLLGREAELEDIVQEAFIYALYSIDKLREPTALKSWLLGIAVGKVRTHLRRRWRRRWLSFLPQHELPEPDVPVSDPHADLVSEVCSILDLMPDEERIALVVHRIEGLPLHEAAAACGMSLSTFKRRFAKAEQRFFTCAKRHPGLSVWLQGGAT